MRTPHLRHHARKLGVTGARGACVVFSFFKSLDYAWSRYEDMPRFTDEPEEEVQILKELQGHPNVVRAVGEFKRPCDPDYFWYHPIFF